MTAQIPDFYRFEGRRNEIIAMTEQPYFNPREYGFQPIGPHTACSRGYYCEFAVRYKKLYLDKLHIHCLEDKYPTFLGVQPEDDPHFSGKQYKGLKYMINYTGKIVIGDHFLEKYYIHMGYQRAWAYEKVIELVFENGVLTERIDHSDFVAKIREKIDQDPEFENQLLDYDNIIQFIDDSFSLNSDVKAWWI